MPIGKELKSSIKSPKQLQRTDAFVSWVTAVATSRRILPLKAPHQRNAPLRCQFLPPSQKALPSLTRSLLSLEIKLKLESCAFRNHQLRSKSGNLITKPRPSAHTLSIDTRVLLPVAKHLPLRRYNNKEELWNRQLLKMFARNPFRRLQWPALKITSYKFLISITFLRTIALA